MYPLNVILRRDARAPVPVGPGRSHPRGADGLNGRRRRRLSCGRLRRAPCEHHPHAARYGPAKSPTSAGLVAHPAGEVESRGAPFVARPVPRMASESCRKIANPGNRLAASRTSSRPPGAGRQCGYSITDKRAKNKDCLFESSLGPRGCVCPPSRKTRRRSSRIPCRS